MARSKSTISDIQKDIKLFELLKEKALLFGYERVAKASDLKSYQVVMNYFSGKVVMRTTEEKIVKGIHLLITTPSEAYTLAQTIVN